MSSLEEKVMASIRHSLWKANSEEFRSTWKKAIEINGLTSFQVLGETVVMEFRDLVLRDVIAYITCRFAFLKNMSVFGGFVRSHYSGKPWSDLDMMYAGLSEVSKLLVELIDFVSFTLGLPKYCMNFIVHSGSHYGKSVDFKVCHLDRRVLIRFDIVFKGPLNPSKLDVLPISVGSCLEMVGVEQVGFRQDSGIIVRRMKRWNVAYIINLLQAGQDIKLCLKKVQPVRGSKYASYYWIKIQKMLHLKWEFVAIDGDEPQHIPEQELRKMIHKYTALKVKAAEDVEET